MAYTTNFRFEAILKELKLKNTNLTVVRQGALLGVTVNVANVWHHALQDERADKAVIALKRVRYAPIDNFARAEMAGTAGSSRYLYGTELCMASVAARNRFNRAMSAAIWKETFCWRNRAVVFTIVYKGHILDADMAAHYHALRTARYQLQSHPELISEFEEVWRLRQDISQTSKLPGVVGRLAQAVQYLNWTWDTPLTFTCRLGPPVHLLRQQHGWWMHNLRSQLRLAMWEKASRLRKDNAGMFEGLDYDATSAPGRSKAFHNMYTKAELNFLRRFLCGSIATKDRLFRANRAKNATCRCGCKETITHILYECDYWRGCRQHFFENTTETERAAWPTCLSHCGLMPLGEHGQRELALLNGITAEMVNLPVPPAISPTDAEIEVFIRGYLLCATDGACRNQQIAMLRRGGYGVFFGIGHSQNYSGKLLGCDQSAYRAELAALTLAVWWAWMPTKILIDNAAVVAGWNMMISENRLPKGNSDLWQRIYRAWQAKRHENPDLPYFIVEKIMGHATLKDVAAGKISALFREYNRGADALATAGADTHKIPVALIKMANYRRRIAWMVQDNALRILIARSQLNKADPEGTFSLEQAERFAKGLPTEPPDIEDIEDYADFALPSVDEEEDDPLGLGLGFDHDDPMIHKTIVKEDQEEAPPEKTYTDCAEMWSDRVKLFPGYQWDELNTLTPPEKGTMPLHINRQIGGVNTTWPYKLHFFEPLAWYWNSLQWSTIPYQGTTWLELAIDFWLATSMLPIRDHEATTATPAQLAKQFASMSRRVRQIMKVSLAPCDTTCYTPSLLPFGLPALPGFVGRAKFRRSEHVHNVIIRLLIQADGGSIPRKDMSTLVISIDRMPPPLWRPIVMNPQNVVPARRRIREKRPASELDNARLAPPRKRLRGKQTVTTSITEKLPDATPRPPRRQVLEKIADDIGSTRTERAALAGYRGKARNREIRRLSHNRTAVARNKHFMHPVPQWYDPAEPVLQCRDCTWTAKYSWLGLYLKQECGRNHLDGEHDQVSVGGRSKVRGFLLRKRAVEWCDKQNLTAQSKGVHKVEVVPLKTPLQYVCGQCHKQLPGERSESGQRKCSAWPGCRKRCFEDKALTRVEEHNRHADGYGFHLLEVVVGAYPVQYKCRRAGCNDIISGRPVDVFSFICPQAPAASVRETAQQQRVSFHNQHADRLGRHRLVRIGESYKHKCTRCEKPQCALLQAFMIAKCPNAPSSHRVFDDGG